MKIDFLNNEDGIKLLCGSYDREAHGVYAGDLLSWVMSHATADDIWVTIMSNINVVAVATLTEAACVIICEGVEPDAETLEAARAKGVTLLCTDDTVYGICRMLAGYIKDE